MLMLMQVQVQTQMLMPMRPLTSSFAASTVPWQHGARPGPNPTQGVHGPSRWTDPAA